MALFFQCVCFFPPFRKLNCDSCFRAELEVGRRVRRKEREARREVGEAKEQERGEEGRRRQRKEWGEERRGRLRSGKAGKRERIGL